ncbi:sigma-70 family RNA polymerase sigma factor [Macrococcus animalis]|uniref:sigma-70 family RNA polymerase sigma factor n=1 Tax=Macrococcus animalis TaxID=3395467 RepID=UPI0039BDD419
MFEQIKANYDKMIYHFIHKYKLNFDFDEYYQLALIKLWELEQSYDATKTEKKEIYIYTKLNFYFIDEIRKLARRTDRFIVTDDEFMKHNMSVNDEYDMLFIEDIKLLLSDREFTWLSLTLQGYKMKEIAIQMNLSVSAIKKYKQSTKNKLKKHYNQFNF